MRLRSAEDVGAFILQVTSGICAVMLTTANNVNIKCKNAFFIGGGVYAMNDANTHGFLYNQLVRSGITHIIQAIHFGRGKNTCSNICIDVVLKSVTNSLERQLLQVGTP